MATTDPATLAPLSAEGRLALLGSSADGLSAAQAAARLARAGPNEPVRRQQRHLAREAASQFTHTLALLLWFAAGLSFAAGITELGLAIVTVVAVNGAFAFVQEYRASHLVEGLMRRVAVRAAVRRDGRTALLAAATLVPGDIVELTAGDVVPADCVLVEADNLSLDLSMLTGESAPVGREAGPAAPSARAAEMSCVAPGGAAVVTGTATAVVFATGPESSIGQIARLVQDVGTAPSELERQVRDLSRLTAGIAVVAGTVVLTAASLVGDTGFAAALTFSTGVIVALVPEGLLPTLSVALAIGASRMAGRGVAVRRLSAIEVVGGATVICTDKTGTLTQNAISVAEVTPHGSATVLEIARTVALCNNAEVSDANGDPVDRALLAWAGATGVDIAAARAASPRRADIPFDARRRWMSVTTAGPEGSVEWIKGAPEAVAGLTGTELPAAMDGAMAAAAARGQRTLLAARRTSERVDVLGMVALEDPPRAEVPGAIRAARSAGIRIIMLTGDHPETARAVAAQVGLADGTVPVLSGADLDRMSDAELMRSLARDAVIARIDPEQKLRVVSALRRAGEIVVVTGDGVNDAPALRAAHVGVAMGLRGTEVAKQAADIVLADDNFATIVAAIEEGRSLKANIRRFASYVFTSNVAEVAPFVLYILLPMPLGLAVIQALAIDIGTDLLPALALGAERPAADAMRVPPEPPSRPLLTRAVALQTFLFFGLIEAALGVTGFLLFHWVHGWRPFATFEGFEGVSADATTATFLAIVGGQVGCLVAQRAGGLRARLTLSTNRWIAWGIGSEVALAVALVYTPGLNGWFEFHAIAPGWLLLLPGAAAAFLVVDQLRRGVGAVVRRPGRSRALGGAA
ncbi:MAG: cation-translocating P-type ATPase [Dehalococcoidia bacterium]